MNMEYQKNYPLKELTTLRIGGPAARLYQPKTAEDIARVLKDAKEENARIFILGNGSNVLFPDEGFDGWILNLADNWSGIHQLENNRIQVKSGTTNTEVAQFCARHGLSGYEFASGIPGTIGGAVFMNAGAYDGETCEILESADYMDMDGNIHTLTADELEFGYRHSWFTEHPGVILSAIYQLQPAEPMEIAEKIADLKRRRWEKQPMDKASAGSTFKRPVGNYASKLIHDCNLQGLNVNDAMVSTKHAGFLINNGNATCQDFLELVNQVISRVKEETGYELEMEIRYVH
ncbi:MAG: UDP-N-acetylmuramate dehydrogenase [Erysipelotrichaceae bacterium]|nr:UDP-N-acetylmuramate dehydrogenase [Erysipelotrichaceae bacterium]